VSPRSARQFLLFLVPILVVGVVVATVSTPVGAQGASGNNSTSSGGGSVPKMTVADNGRVFNIAAQEDASKCPDGKVPCWDTTLLVVNPGDKVTVNVDLTKAAQPHNMDVTDFPGGAIKAPPTVSNGDVYQLSFTFPASGANVVNFVCDAHPATMQGRIGIASALAAAPAEGSNVPELGVHFLSYWVGVIAFLLLFLVYGLTFFLFKYNETSATTDQWERAGAGAPEFKRRFSPGAASLLALVVAGVIIAAVIFVARR